MDTSAVSATTSTTSTTTDRGVESLSSDDFFQLLIAELQQQDPLEPTDTSDMIAQITNIRSIETSSSLTDVLASLADSQRTSGTSDMLGKYVTAAVSDDEGNAYYVAGIVTGIQFDSSGEVVLELDTGETILGSSVVHVMTAETAEAMIDALNQNAESSDEDTSDKSTTTSSTRQTESTGLLGWLGNALGL